VGERKIETGKELNRGYMKYCKWMFVIRTTPNEFSLANSSFVRTVWYDVTVSM